MTQPFYSRAWSQPGQFRSLWAIVPVVEAGPSVDAKEQVITFRYRDLRVPRTETASSGFHACSFSSRKLISFLILSFKSFGPSGAGLFVTSFTSS